jgi:hypothetical protein
MGQVFGKGGGDDLGGEAEGGEDLEPARGRGREDDPGSGGRRDKGCTLRKITLVGRKDEGSADESRIRRK